LLKSATYPFMLL